VTGPSRSARRAHDALAALGFEAAIVELPDSARTAVEAAAAVGCELGQIAKSLVFRGPGDAPLLVITSGANRADEAKVAAIAGGRVAMGDADYVRAHTGFAIGGVPPAGHPERIPALIDQDLMAFAEVWAAAGNPRAVFPLTPQALVDLAQARVAGVATHA
jgi:prolyl-tRNA editing enzyme YbaK/EbsC (Cys-tRNA(Pro) deacylase)